MRWPWVSRLAYDTVRGESDRLREQNAQLLAHITRMDRVEHGLGETPRPERLALQPMPGELKAYIASFATPAIQKTMRDQAYRRHAKGQSWETIAQDVMREDSEEEAERDE